MLKQLGQDNAVVKASAFVQVIPELEERHEAFRRELEEERARDEELAGCDQEHLEGLQEAIVEQESVTFPLVIPTFRS